MLSFPQSGGIDDSVVRATEQQITDAGIALSILRLRWFSQNFSEDFLLDSTLAGELRIPAGNGREAFVDTDDIAEVSVAALTDAAHAGESLEVTGPRLMSSADTARELSAATGRSITYVPVTVDEFVSEHVAGGVPADWARLLGELYAHIGTDALASTSDDVARILGRPARDFTDYARTTAGTGVWSI